jgi:uncharacterized repeat protein (TIGR03803 family)
VLHRFFAALALAILLPASPSGAASKYKILHAFGKGKDGGGIFAGVTFDGGGNLYGTTWGGGAYGEGTVFELTSGSSGKWSERILHSFCQGGYHCVDGSLPASTPAFDPAGNFYGTSNIASFELSPDQEAGTGWSFSVIYENAGSSSFTIDGAGNLYGAGNAFGQGGSVWELTPGSSGWGLKELHIFCSWHHCDDGMGAPAPPVFDAAGNLYGTTKEGGVHNAGVAFELEYTAGAWKEYVLHSFPAFQGDGYTIYAGVVLDAKGNVYGTTFQGGMGNNNGTVFELSQQKDGRWKETILYDFNNADQDGGSPRGGLVLDKAGNLYGTTTAGGDPSCLCGVVFKMMPGSNGKWKYKVLHRFTGKDGYDPEAGVVLDDKGNLYGTTSEGGPGGYGVVYEITP